MDRQAIRDFIAASSWFEGAPEGALDKLVDAATFKLVPASSYLWAMGESNTELFGVVSGRIRMYVSSPMGQEFVLVDREQGSWLGEAALKDDQGRVIGAQAQTESEVLIIHRKVLRELGEEWPLLYRNLFIHSAKTSRGLYELLAGMLFYPLKTRVAARLLELVPEHGQEVDEGVMIDIKVSQNDFARLAMGSRQRVNRIFRSWDKRGLVVIRNDHLLIRDIALFEEEVEPFE